MNFNLKDYLPAQYKEIVRHFSYVFLLRVLQQVVGFVSFFFIIHYLPKEVIGDYHFVLSCVALVSIMSLPGMRVALVQSIARDHGGFFVQASRYSFLGACAGTGILLGIAGYYYLFAQDNLMTATFVVAALINPLGKGLFLWRSSYAGAERFKMLSIFEAGETLITSLLLMVSVLFYKESHIVLLSVALAVPAVLNLFLWFPEYKKYHEEKGGEEGMESYGFKTSAYQIFPVVAKEIDRICVYNFVSAAELAAYSVASKIPEAIKMLFQNLGDVITPKFARMKGFTDKLDRILGLLSLVSFFVIIVFAFTLFPLLFNGLVPAEYADSLLYAQILLCSVAIGNHAILRARYIRAQKDADSFRSLMVVGMGIRIVTVLLFVPFWGVWGAVIAVFIQRIFTSVFTEYLIRTKYRPVN